MLKLFFYTPYVPREDLLQRGSEESLCGRRDLQHVNSYNGKLGVSKGYVNEHKGAVGALTRSNSQTGGKYCTGTLIAKDLFLTASHCVSRSIVGQYVAFGYERLANGSGLRQQEFFKITRLVEDGAAKGLDYAIVQLERDAGSGHGVAAVRAQDPRTGATLAIIQHPGGEPKQVEAGKMQGRAGNYLRYNGLDTLPGSSGSGVLDAGGSLVGVHTNGGCTATGGSNYGVRLSQVARVSSIIK